MPGYKNHTNLNQCGDRNECLEFPQLCSRGPYSRNVCKNVVGAFECSIAPDPCADNYGDCWHSTVNGKEEDSCEVRRPPRCARW
jgi:hypothetical protein